MRLTEAQIQILRALRGGANDHYSIAAATSLEPWRVNAILNDLGVTSDPPMPAGLVVRTPSGHPLHVYTASTYRLTLEGLSALLAPESSHDR